MAVTPRGSYALPVAVLREMVANCTAFQKLCKAASASAALARVVPFGQAGDAARPCAIVNISEHTAESIGAGVADAFRARPSLVCEINIDQATAAAVAVGTSETSFTSAALVGFANDHFNGLQCRFTSGDLIGVVRAVSDFDGSTGALTTAAFAAAPKAGDTFVLEAANVADLMTWFFNVMGDIQADLLALSSKAGFTTSAGDGALAFKSVRISDYGRTPINQADVYCGAVLVVELA
jgi:hypothetical protein